MANKKRGAQRKQSKLAALRWPKLSIIHWYWTVGVVLALLLTFGANQLWQRLNNPEHMPIEIVKIDGELEHVSLADLQKKVMASVDGSFFSVNVGKVKKAARQVPWVNDVQVRKIWPNTLSLTVDEHKAYAQFNNKQLINGKGKLFSPPANSFPSGLANLQGNRGDVPRLWKSYVTMQRKLTDIGLRIAQLQLTDRGAWLFHLTNDVDVLLGSSDISQRFERFITIYPRLLEQTDRRPDRLDMRYSNGLAVDWKEVEQVVSNEIDQRGKS